ncbi:FecR domain-containing protein [Pantoea sp. 18069]|uniref:FecR family protein n=1 Tax=Pantoea sp. 18069 TaxID=2681415 RepID=UPI00135AA459|nr:FecR domain-containing protein [Pantoea sp. 18069]
MSAKPSPSLLQDLPPEQVLALNHRAGDWHVRRQQPGWSSADERALDAWLAEDARHREAMERVGRAWREAAQLKAMFPAAYGPAPQAAASRAAPPVAGRRTASIGQGWWRGPVLGSACALALVAMVGYGWHRWDNTAGYSVDVATGPGELRSIALPDGSQVALNANSQLQVRYYPRRRETVLDKGEAFFTVAPAAARPFTVASGGHQVRVVGTAFNVRTGPPEFVVQVQQGRVEVRSTADAGAPVVVMGPGSGLAIDPLDGHRRESAVLPEAIAEWTSGQIYFKRLPLAQVAKELARHLVQPVEVEGAALQSLPISGFLALKDPERFLLALPSVAEVRVQRRSDGGWVIRRR